MTTHAYNLYLSNSTKEFYVANGNQYQHITYQKGLGKIRGSHTFGNGELKYIGTGTLDKCLKRINSIVKAAW